MKEKLGILFIGGFARSFTLKKVMKTYESEDANRTKARNVLKPPFHTAVPIVRRVVMARSRNIEKVD